MVKLLEQAGPVPAPLTAWSVIRPDPTGLPARFDHLENAMHTILEFPAKVFVQWGAIAQEIVPYLVQRGVKRDEIGAVLDRLRTRWEQLGPAVPDKMGPALPGEDAAAHVSRQLEEDELYVSRHWRSQPARMLIESAMADHQRHTRR